jgi:sulfatase maturation enzyme AslB (radical SAM superfamily)
MSCAYCSVRLNGSSYSLEELITVTDNIFRDFDGMVRYEIFGGEPLLEYATVFKLLEYVIQKYDTRVIQYDIYTNATILNEEILSFFITHKEKMRLCLSLDGVEESNAERKLNNSNSYAVVSKNLSTILARGINNRIQFTAHTGNVSYISAGVKHLYDLGFRNIRVGILCRSAEFKPAQEALMPDDAYITVFKEEMRKLYAFVEDHPDLYLRNFTESWETINRGPFKFEVERGKLEVDEVCYALNSHVEKISRAVYDEYQAFRDNK